METLVLMILAMKRQVAYTRNTIAMMVTNAHMIFAINKLDATMKMLSVMTTLV
jgi:hypothetical protein